MSILGLLIGIIILAIVFGLLWYAVGLIPIEQPFLNIVKIAVIILFVVAVLGILTGAFRIPVVGI